MHIYNITIEYDGTNFVGWQTQKNGASIQETIQKILESSKINPFRGYRQKADLYYLDYIHYLNDQPLPISTSFFS